MQECVHLPEAMKNLYFQFVASVLRFDDLWHPFRDASPTKDRFRALHLEHLASMARHPQDYTVRHHRSLCEQRTGISCYIVIPKLPYFRLEFFSTLPHIIFPSCDPIFHTPVTIPLLFDNFTIVAYPVFSFPKER